MSNRIPVFQTPITFSLHNTCLEPLTLAHFDALCEQIAEPEMWRYMGTGDLSTPERLHSWIESVAKEREAGTGLAFAIVSINEGKAVGSTSLFDISAKHRSAEIGRTWLGATYRRTALNTEAKYLLLTYAFETLNLNRVQIKTDARNIRSQQAIERIGATKEGVLRSHMVLWDGYVRDTVMYSIIAPEWSLVKAHIEQLMRVTY